MKPEQLTELEMFRMAVQLTEAALANVPNALSVINREDVIHERIIECHSAIQRAARDLLRNDQDRAH